MSSVSGFGDQKLNAGEEEKILNFFFILQIKNTSIRM